jgi:N-acetylglutamate synthase-like GNAT family acetyltransferase
LIPTETVTSRIAKLKSHCNRTTLPIAWVALVDGQVAGTAALRTHDLDSRPDLIAWLGGVFVRAEFRGRGVATELCRHVEQKAYELGTRQLYLFTIDQQSLYTRLGWQVLHPTIWAGKSSVVMSKTLVAN